jgi:hypothetical protein
MASLLSLGADCIVDEEELGNDEQPASGGSAVTPPPTFGSLGRHATFTGPWAEIPTDVMAATTLNGICQELTLRPSQVMAGARRLGDAVICYQLVGEEPNGQHKSPGKQSRILRVPRAYFHQRFGKPGRDDTSVGKPVRAELAFEGALRDDRQKTFVARMVSTLLERKVTIALGSAEPGCGKTVMFLYIWAVVLRRRCLVVVHGLPIVAQWIAAARRFCPAARVGIIHQDVWQVRDRDLVVASSDTLAARADQFTADLWREFGVICFDEAHHIMASTFVAIYQRCMHARYCISLTGTPYRKDGLTAAMPFLTGPNAASMKNTDPVHVRCIQFSGGLQTRIEFKFGPGKGKPNEAAMISAMVEDERRTRLVAQVVRDAVVAGRKVLVLCDRNELREAIRILVLEMLGVARPAQERVAEGSGEADSHNDLSLDIPPCPTLCRPWVKAKATEAGNSLLLRRRVMDIYDRIYIEPYRVAPTAGEERRTWMQKLQLAKAKLGASDEQCLSWMVPPRVVPDLQQVEQEVPASWVESLNAGDDHLARSNKHQARAILATYVMAREALDIPGLNTLVLATPSSDVRQAVGRIRRTGAGPASAAAAALRGIEGHAAPATTVLDAPEALVVDVVDAFPPFHNWAMTRQRYYDAERFKVTRANVHAPSDRWDATEVRGAGSWRPASAPKQPAKRPKLEPPPGSLLLRSVVRRDKG